MKEYYIKVEVDVAPTTEKEFKEYCEKYGFDFLGLHKGSRKAWCSSLSTYFRDAYGVGNANGDIILVYKEDLIEISSCTN